MPGARAEDIVRGLNGRWHGGYALCRCPAHQDMSPSLSVRRSPNDGVYLKCFAGCDFPAIRDALVALHLWPDHDKAVHVDAPIHPPVRFCGMVIPETMKGRQIAQAIWDESYPVKGTLAEEYLRGRGIKIPLPDQLRFHKSLKHRESEKRFPCMVARLSDEKGFVGIQRTYLDGPKKADIPCAKKTLGRMYGSAVRLRLPVTDTLGLAEGIETALSASQLYSLAVWATLSANRLAAVEIPRNVMNVIVFGDAGDVGRREAFEAADTYERHGLKCEVIFPGAHFAGASDDFNTVLRGAA